MRRYLLLPILALLWCGGVRAAETLPPEPGDHVTDYATLVAPSRLQPLELELVQFERDTSNHLLVVVYPGLPPETTLEDYTQRLFESWGAGQKGRKTMAVLFIFAQDRKVRIVTGDGLKAALSDRVCTQIVEDELAPRFRSGDYSEGIASAVHALVAAIRGDYHGPGKISAGRHVDNESGDLGVGGFGLVIFGLVVLSMVREFFRRTVIYTRDGRRTIWLYSGPAGGGGSPGGGGAGGSW